MTPQAEVGADVDDQVPITEDAAEPRPEEGAPRRQIASTIGGAARTVAEQTPAVVSASRGAAGAVMKRVNRSSTDSLRLGIAFFTGITTGLIVGRAPRWLQALSLVPIVALGSDLARRRMMRPPR
jgi:hypothetical protein